MANQEVTGERGRLTETPRSFLHPIASLQNEIDRVFGDFFQTFDTGKFLSSSGALVPKADFSENATSYELSVEVPGVSEKELTVSVKNGVLTIKGEKKNETTDKQVDFIRTERSYGSYVRSMTLPEDADEPKILAQYANGVLRIVIPKSADAKSKSQKIEIKKA